MYDVQLCSLHTVKITVIIGYAYKRFVALLEFLYYATRS